MLLIVNANSNESTLKSGFEINKKKKIDYVNGNNTAYWQFMQLKMNDLRGDGIVYYLFDVNRFYRVNENFEVVSEGNYSVNRDKKLYELTTEDNQKFLFKISLSSQIVDIKSKFYDYKGFRRYQFVLAEANEQEKIRSAIKNFKENRYAKIEIDPSQAKNVELESALDIDKSEKIKFLEGNESYFWGYTFLIDDLRGNGAVYYKFQIDHYHRLDRNFNVISKGSYKFDQGILKLTEDKLKFDFKISILNKVVDIKSKFYDYKGFKRYRILEATKKQKKLVSKSTINFGKNRYAGYSESDDNLDKLWKIILDNKDIQKKYLKYTISKKLGSQRSYPKFKGDKIKTMGLAVFIDYKKELSKLTKDKNLKEISPFAWGWAYSTKDETATTEINAIKRCYDDVAKKKMNMMDKKCVVVDVRRFTDDHQYPMIWKNMLRVAKKNRILLAKESEKSEQQLAAEKKKKEADEKKRKELLIAQKKAEEERKKQELLLAKKKKEEEKRKKELLLAQKKAEEERKKEEELLAKKKDEDERKKQELILAQKKAEEEKKKQELLLAQKKAEEERKKEEELLAKKKAEEEKKKQELLLAQKKADEEKKQEELIAKLKEQEKKKLNELELAQKEAEKAFEEKKKKLNVDKESPEILVAEAITVTSQAYKLKGKIKDKSDFFLEVDGQPIQVNEQGEFIFEGFIINTNQGEELTLVAVDRWNNSTEKSVKINVELKEMKVAKGYEKLLPNKIKVNKDKNKIAIIIGVEKYEYLTNLDAAFANRDANAFREYAVRALGVDPSNINLLVDKDANRPKILKALKLWLPKIGGENRDIYLFFAGHGLASDDGKNLYILPQDGDASLLEDTAITRSEIIKLLQKTNPKSVTMFFDTCYSGQTRNEETLVASLRPVRIVADDQEIPNNFTIFTASANDQTSGSIEEAKHGMFSYYLMKGMEGAADQNNDNKISNGELIAYVQENVSKVAFSQNREQDPNMSGDKDKILFSYK